MIVIHGEQNFGYELSKDLKARCDKALEIRKDKEIIVCTGGLFNKEQQGTPVAVAMKEYIGSKNPFIWIITEEGSITSIHNVECLSSLPEATVVSSYYHIPRLWLIWKMTKTKVRFVGAPCSFTLKRFFLELLGIFTFLLYIVGFKSRELNFRKKRHETNNKSSISNREVHTQLQSD